MAMTPAREEPPGGEGPPGQGTLPGLSRAVADMAESGSLPATLDAIASEVKDGLGLAAANIVLHAEADAGYGDLLGSAGFPGTSAERSAGMQRCDALGAEFKYREAQRARRLVVVPRRYAAVMRDPRWAPSHQTLSTVRWDGYVAAPLEARGRVVGTLSAFYPSALTSAAQTEVDRLTVVADQAAAAVDNAGLLAKTRHWAVIAERNRLGRELHNAIMQLADQSRTLQASAAADGPVDAARIRADAAELVDLSGSALTALQALISGLRPVATRRLSALTPRELEVLALLAEGCSNQEIARRLAITERTARTHVSNLLGKLRLGSRTQAALLAHQEGLYGGSTQGGSYARG